MDASYVTHTGVEAHVIRRFETTCYIHILDLDRAQIKLVRGFMAVDERAKQNHAQLAFNANGWGLQPNGTGLSNEYLVIEGVVVQATAIDYRPCMNISQDGVIEFLDRPNLQTAWNVIGFDRYIARGGVYNKAIDNPFADPRTVYGVDASGCLIILVCEGRTSTEKGLTFPEIWSVMQEFGAVDCGNADGGYSSCAYNSFFGGLMNESYKLEYRHTVMQVLFFANQLGEVPVEEPPIGETMNYEVLIDVTPRLNPTMYEQKTLSEKKAGSKFSGSVLHQVDALGMVDDKVIFIQDESTLYWMPITYKGKTYVREIVVDPAPVTTGIDVNVNLSLEGKYTVKVDGAVVFEK